MRKVCLYLFCSLFLDQASAQSDSSYTFTLHDGTQYKLEIIENEPSLLPNFFLGTGFNVGTRPLNSWDFLIPLQAGIYFPNKAFIEAKADIPLVARFDTQYDQLIDNENLQTTNKFYINTQFDIGGGYFFIDTAKLRDVKVKFNARLENGKDTLMETKLKGNIRHTFGARGGYYFYQSGINNLYHEGINDYVGIDLAEYSETHSIKQNRTTPIHHTNFRSHSIYIGVDFRKNYRMVYEEGNDSIINRSRIYNLYADFMFSPITTIEDMSIRDFDSGEKTEHDMSSVILPRKWGFRVGGEAKVPFGERGSMAIQLETGIRPGIKDINSQDNLLGNMAFLQSRVIYKFGTKLNFSKKEASE